MATQAKPGDNLHELIRKLVGNLWRQGDTINDMLRRLVDATAGAASSGGSVAFTTGTTSPIFPPANQDAPALYYDTAGRFSFTWDIAAATWVAIPKCYRALVDSSSGQELVLDVQENTLGGNVSTARQSNGFYQLNSNGLFTPDRTLCFASTADTLGIASFTMVSANRIELSTANGGGNADEILWRSPLEILVYPVWTAIL